MLLLQERNKNNENREREYVYYYYSEVNDDYYAPQLTQFVDILNMYRIVGFAPSVTADGWRLLSVGTG